MVAEKDSSDTEEMDVPLSADQVRSLARDSLSQLRTFAGELVKLDKDNVDAATVEYLLDMLGDEINV